MFFFHLWNKLIWIKSRLNIDSQLTPRVTIYTSVVYKTARHPSASFLMQRNIYLLWNIVHKGISSIYSEKSYLLDKKVIFSGKSLQIIQFIFLFCSPSIIWYAIVGFGFSPKSIIPAVILRDKIQFGKFWALKKP